MSALAAIATEREKLLADLSRAEAQYPDLRLKADRAVAAQMRVYEEIKDLKARLETLDEAEKLLS